MAVGRDAKKGGGRMRPTIYSKEQISAVCAIAALSPRPTPEQIAAITGVSFAAVRYYIGGRAKPLLNEWAADVINAIKSERTGQNEVAAYYLVSAAKQLMKTPVKAA